MDQYSSSEILISVLVPVYGAEDYIERCAKSLFEQTDKEGVEFVFVDDCAKDNSIDVLKNVIAKYSSLNVKIVHHSHNRGLAAARQTAIENSSGQYILTVDADDWIEKNTISILKANIVDTNPDVLFFDYFINFKNKQVIEQYEIDKTSLGCLSLLFKGKIHGGTCLKLIKRDLYTVNNIRYIEGLNMFEDISVVYRLLYYAKTVAKVDIPLYHYYQGNQNSYTYSISKRSEENISDLISLMEDFFRKNQVSESLSLDFMIFKQRVNLLLITSTSSYATYLDYKTRLVHNQAVNRQISKVEKVIYDICRIPSKRMSFCLLGAFRYVKRVKQKINNR